MLAHLLYLCFIIIKMAEDRQLNIGKLNSAMQGEYIYFLRFPNFSRFGFYFACF
jgi:hypothetical protein